MSTLNIVMADNTTYSANLVWFEDNHVVFLDLITGREHYEYASKINHITPVEPPLSR